MLKEISASDVGVLFSDEPVAASYFFDQLYFDSDLEKTNIKTEIKEVIVFTKIPKNSIKIPVAGGLSYAPDFAYVLKYKDVTPTVAKKYINIVSTFGEKIMEERLLLATEEFITNVSNILKRCRYESNDIDTIMESLYESINRTERLSKLRTSIL